MNFMNVMAVPNPNAYVVKKPMTLEDARYIKIGTEDGWLECKGSKDWDKYLEAKTIVEEYELEKTIKLEAYKEFVTKLKDNIDDEEDRILFPSTLTPKVAVNIIIDKTLKEMEREI